MVSIAEHGRKGIKCAWSPDTDLLMFLLDLVSAWLPIEIHNNLECLTGNDTKYREITVVERVNVIESRKCKGLIGLLNWG